MKIESVYATSVLIGATPQGKTEVHKTEVDQHGHKTHSVVEYPFFSYSAAGKIEALKELGKNVDKMA
jgi:hypothetical protein